MDDKPSDLELESVEYAKRPTRDGDDASQRFLNRMVAVPEPEMRVALWKERFLKETPEIVLDTVDALLASAQARHESARVGILSFARFLQRHRILAKQTLMPIAVVSGHATILALLVDEPPLKSLNEEELDRAAAKEDRETTLGERRALARRPDRNLIDRLLNDPDPLVIRNVLGNPRTIEQQVLQLASKRPVSGAVLIEVFQHSRWGLRPHIQLALVQNPYTPITIALGLLPLMPRADLIRLQHERSIHPLIRGWARTQVSRTPSTKSPQIRSHAQENDGTE